MNTHSYFSLFGTIWLCTGSLAADPLAEWTWRNPLPQGNGGMSIAFGDDRFISAGLVGTLMHSTDGLNWAPLRSPTEKPLSGIAYGNGIFVAVGPDVILRSGDSGNGWSVQQSPTGSSNALLSVHFVNGSFFVGAHEGMMLVSQDGIDWQVRLLPRKARLHGLAFGEGHYVSVGSEGIIVSDDGINWRWVQDDAGAGTLTAVSFGNGNYVAVGGSGTILISDDSEQWSNRSLPERSGYFSDILYTNQCFVASLWGGGVRLSGDGVNWTNPAPSFKGILSALVYARGLYVGVGTPPGWGDRGEYWASSNLVEWIDGLRGHNGKLSGITAGTGMLVAVGSQNLYDPEPIILTSSDAKRWTERLAPPGSQLNCVAYGDYGFIAGGAETGAIVRSVDGVSWAKIQTSFDIRFNEIIWAKNRYFAIGEPIFPGRHAIISSSDGLEWNAHLAYPGLSWGPDSYAIASGLGMLVVVGEFGQILTSTDGLSWSPQFSGTSLTLQDIAFGNGQFVAVGSIYLQASVVLHSRDGTNWVAQNDGPDSPSAISYGDGVFVVTTFDGKVWKSADAITWDYLCWPAYMPLNDVAYFDGTFVAVGPSGTTVQSGSMTVPRLEITWDNVSFVPEIALSGAIGRNYRIDFQDELWMPWREWTNFTMTTFQSRWRDSATTDSSRYYRAVLIH